MADVERLRAFYSGILPYYDASLEERGDLPFWESIARRWSSKRILELGCGTGRVTMVLTRHARVTAVDLLIELLLRASQKAPETHFVAADLREFAFASPFDLVVLANDPMAHITSIDARTKVIERIAGHLTPDGRVVLEGLYRPPGKSPVVPARKVLRHGAKLFAVEESWMPGSADAIWNVTYRHTKGSSIMEAATVLRSWTLEEVRGLGNAGLQVEHLWGDFDQRPFSADSERMVIVGKRL